MSFDKNILRKIEFKHSNTWLYANELFNAIDDFYKTEDEYKYFAEVEGRERGIVFRIAHILANRLERKYNVYVDCEANRCNGEVKSIDICKPILDLIIHKRNSTSYVVVEFKVSENIEALEHDYEKLEYLTNDNRNENSKINSPTYDLGVSILLGDDGIREVKCFVNGKEYQFDAQ